jgi:hypothetical protein
MNTMQQEFDAVVAHLYTQGKPALYQEGCAYRGDNGTMCAVGCRIPDSMYSSKMEGESATSLLPVFDLPAEIHEYSAMFQDLQYAHDSHSNRAEDGYFDKTRLSDHLRNIAEKHKLTFTAPQ